MGGGGRRGVRWYADCLVDLVRHHAQKDPICRFVVHVHGALDFTFLEDLHRTLRQNFLEARGGVDDPLGVTLDTCDAALPAMWPQAARVATFLDHPSDMDTTVMVDIHDDLDKQLKLVNQLEEEMAGNMVKRSLALTFWKTEGNLATSFLSDPSVYPPTSLNVQRTAAMIRDDQHYSLDAGLAVCGATFRTQLRRCAGYVSYRDYLAAMAMRIAYDETRGTDESLMKYYLLTQTPSIMDLVRNSSVLFTHTLRARRKDPPRRVATEGDPPPPTYVPQLGQKLLKFAYDEEHQGSLQFRELKWESPKGVSRRHRSR